MSTHPAAYAAPLHAYAPLHAAPLHAAPLHAAPPHAAPPHAAPARRLVSTSLAWLRAQVCSRLLGQCLEEVYEGANHVCIVMHWGTHELDAHHQLAASVLEALRLLRELVPPAEVPAGDLMLQKADAQRLMMRAVELDCHLQSNLFI